MVGIWLRQKVAIVSTHPKKQGRMTVAGHPNDDLAPGTFNSVIKQAQIDKPMSQKGKKP
jgi:predicted RNA binding protein YcfA (HicA-like mRNA interferase family)